MLQIASAFFGFILQYYCVVADAIGNGMRCMVPMRLLPVFTGAELEEMVCGSTVIDTANLKKFTIYEGCSLTDSHIQYVYLCMRSVACCALLIVMF